MRGRSGGWGRAITAAATLLTAGCGVAPESDVAPEPDVAEPALRAPAAMVPPNLVLVSIDSLRADRLGCYGAERETSPALDALAAGGGSFETVLAPSPWTLPSHVTLFTGLSVSTHRVDAPSRRIDPSRLPLAEHLRNQGYRTAAFVSSPFLGVAYGVERGFDVYQNFQPGSAVFPPSEAEHDASHGDRSADQVIDAALRWLADAAPPPWFLFVHLWDVHYDYDPPPPYDTMFDPGYAGDLGASRLKWNPAISASMAPRELEHLRALYDGEIRWVDAQLARLLDALAERESRERIVSSVVSDHGEEFFEHGNKGHFKTLFEESVRVPWIVRFAGEVPAETRVSGVAGLEDVAPTLLGLAGLRPLPDATGRDLSAALRGAKAPVRPQLLSFGLQRALRGDGWKVTLRSDTREAHYYDLRTDPHELDPQPAQDVAPKRLGRLKNRLRRARAHADSLEWTGAGAATLDAETTDRLRELGYLE